MFYEFTDKLLKKKWTETRIQDLVGNYRELFRAYATDETLRIKAASGGELEAEFLNETRIRKPFSYFSLYQTLHFFSEKKCLVCNDHFGYHADISLGDIWAYRFKQDPIKKTGVIIRSEQGIDYWNSASRGGTITATALDIDDILDGQARTAPFHYNVSARNRVAPLFGYKIPDHVRADVSWHAWLTALITLFNMRWSESKQWKILIFKLPRPLLKAYLYLRKGLETLS
jgi:hypothetical protein